MRTVVGVVVVVVAAEHAAWGGKAAPLPASQILSRWQLMMVPPAVRLARYCSHTHTRARSTMSFGNNSQQW
jgi:hypothetical protein